DLSNSANQPMVSCNGRYVIVYNGEVYNFKEIENELRNSNCELNLKTSSDTEVILEAFSFWGHNFVQKMNGMFAIAIYDKLENSVHIFRDRVGIKPIYYYWDGQNFAFASELKVLKQSDFIKNNISTNFIAVNEYLHLGYIPEPHSIYENIFKFPSGSYAVLSNNKLTFQKYWSLEDKIKKNTLIDETEAKCQLKELLISSVKYRMISDVPFGTFLSGGIDSSLVTAIAQSNSTDAVKTFNIRFTDSKYNESIYANNIAKYLSTNHHEYTVTEKDAIKLIPELINIYDEPYADSSAIPTLLVSKMARQNVTMTLSGDGGDELFMGYGAYRWAERLNNPFIKTFRKPAQLLLSNLSNKYRRASKLFGYQNSETLGSHIFSQEQYLFSRNEIFDLVKQDFYRDILLNENFENVHRKLIPSEKQSLFDFNYYLKDDLLVKVYRASMYSSLETRVPLLDYRIVEFAFNLSPLLKYKNNTSKFLLKEVLYDYIPAKYFDRPKWGFSIPMEKWLNNELSFLIDEYLSKENLTKTNIFNHDYVFNIIKQYRKYNRKYYYNRLWELIVMQKFLIEAI
ncbi:MAG: asparagine synthase (glutamine-hydrolyzing), partial [Bacteroidetes bacterium]|nr:asparagine synthase (glutamine-hydrolyzing) [Bacteroidota bacterium]